MILALDRVESIIVRWELSVDNLLVIVIRMFNIVHVHVELVS